MKREKQSPGCIWKIGCFSIVVSFLFFSFIWMDSTTGGGISMQRPSQAPPPFRMTWETGMYVDQPDHLGNPPLHQAILTGNKKAFDEILAGKPDLTALDRAGRTILLAALEHHQPDMVEWIIREADIAKRMINQPSNARRTPLMAAMEWGNASAAFQLMEMGADLKAVTPSGRTMMHCAAIGGNPVLVEHLLKNGFDVNVEHTGNWTPLHYAAQEGHAEAVSYLLARGADFKARMRSGWTPADLARSRGHQQIVNLLEQRVER